MGSTPVVSITTDGSPLYPEPIRKTFPGARHQICIFHTLSDLNKLVMRALSHFRKSLKPPKGKRGHPCCVDGKQIAKRRRLEKYLNAIFKNRYLWTKKRLTCQEKKVLKKLCRGQRMLKALREFSETVHRLFDRRCRAQTARRKLEKLRNRRFFQQFPQLDPLRRKLQSPNLDRALECLNDKLLERTSNSVERSNRRHRKMQKSVYRARKKHTIDARIKLDMLRDKQLAERCPQVQDLHAQRVLLRSRRVGYDPEQVVKEDVA